MSVCTKRRREQSDKREISAESGSITSTTRLVEAHKHSVERLAGDIAGKKPVHFGVDPSFFTFFNRTPRAISGWHTCPFGQRLRVQFN